MKTKILGLLAKSNVTIVGKSASVVTAEVTGEPDNEVAYISWTEGHLEFNCKLTEEGLENAKFNEATQSFEAVDAEGDVISFKLLADGKVLTPNSDDKVYLFVQEGGSSSELYVHGHSTRAQAEKHRKSCKAAYRTSGIIEAPEGLERHPAFYDTVQALLSASASLAYPEGK